LRWSLPGAALALVLVVTGAVWLLSLRPDVSELQVGDTAAVVGYEAGEFRLPCQAVDKGTEADALHDAGDVDPACGAETRAIGMPARTASVNVAVVSVAKRSGLTIQPRLKERNGRA